MDLFSVNSIYLGRIRILKVFADDIPVHKIYGNKTGLYLAMNSRYRLYATVSLFCVIVIFALCQ